MQSRTEFRFAVVGWFMAALLVAGLVYTFVLQTGYGREFALVACRQQRETVIPLPNRGRIYDVRGRALALNQSSFRVAVFPKLLRNEGKCTTRLIAARVLTEVCGGDYQAILRKMETMPGRYEFATRVDYETGRELKKRLRRARIDNAVVVEPQRLRVYPLAETAGSVVGTVRDNEGISGIERVLDAALSGVPGRIVVQKDAHGNHYHCPDFLNIPPRAGADVRLTIDADFQRVAYEALAWCVDSFRADGGSAIVMDCRSGEIRAMTDFPYRDPRRQWTGNESASYCCKAAEQAYEPGSVFKPVVGLAALAELGAERLRRTRFDVSTGMIEIGGWKIKDVHNCGVQDFAGIFVRSSNVGLAQLSQMLDRRALYETMRRLNLFGLTGIELPNEAAGYIDPDYQSAPQRLSAVRVANNAFGQGVTVSLLQLAVVYATIANDGLLRRPFLVKEIRTGKQRCYEGRTRTVRQALPVAIVQEMKAILRRVVTEGTGKEAASQFFTAAGKTGTAQRVMPGGGYSKEQSIVTFVGYFPAEDPLYVVAVSVDNPRIGRFAGTIACPTFRRIAERCYELRTTENQLAVRAN